MGTGPATSRTRRPPVFQLAEPAYTRILSFPVLLGALLFALVFALARNGFSDPDIWFHLHNAQYLLTTHHVPRVEMFSFTAGGLPWINPEYLAEVPYYFAWQLGGLLGIKVLTLVLLESIYLGLLYLCWKESGNIKASVIASCLAVLLGTVSFGPRTILFGYAYLILLLIIIQRFRRNGKAPLWLLPPLFCLWINTHGSWSLGITVFSLAIVGGLAEGKFGNIEMVRWPAPQLRKLLLTMGASLAALFVNPYGYRLVFYPLDLAFRQKIAVAHVQEWMSVDFHSVRGKVVLVLIVGLILSALLSEWKWRFDELLLVLFGLYTGLTYIRFLILAGILIAPLIAKIFRFVPAYRPEIDKPALNALLIGTVMAFLIAGFPTTRQLQKSIDQDYPTEVLPYLKTIDSSGPVLNSYLWGGYLSWKDPHFREFIDSRADIFVYAGVFKDYLDFQDLQHSIAVLDKYRIRYVLVTPSDSITAVLRRDPNWTEVFKGDVSVVFKRVGTVQPLVAANPVRSKNMSAW